MSFTETNILTPDNVKVEEKIKISPPFFSKCAPMCFMTIWSTISGTIFLFTLSLCPPMSIIPGFFVIIGIITICLIEDGTIIRINNINRTLILQKKRNYNFCLKKKPRVIDLNQIAKISIFNSFKILGRFGLSRNLVITFQNGITEDISKYFKYCSEQSFVNLQNLLRKYLPIENIMPQAMGTYPQNVPIYNPYNANINPGYNINMVQNLAIIDNNCMAQGMPQNYNQQCYNASGNVYNNNVAICNQNDNSQQNLSIGDGVNKPLSTSARDFGAPDGPK